MAVHPAALHHLPLSRVYRAWGPERPIYGTIRYMSYASTSRKFDSAAYIAHMKALAEQGSP